MNERNVILFIDDEEVCHFFVELIIQNFTDYKLVTAFSGKEALLLAKRYANNLALVLLDIVLPDISGYEVYNILKKDDKLKDTYFVFQSGLASQEEELRKNIGKNEKILYKPYNQQDLLNSIEEVMEFKK